jgi:hypothetical protein
VKIDSTHTTVVLDFSDLPFTETTTSRGTGMTAERARVRFTSDDRGFWRCQTVTISGLNIKSDGSFGAATHVKHHGWSTGFISVDAGRIANLAYSEAMEAGLL